MKLKTTYDTHLSKHKISYKDNLMFFGSCFSNNISKKLKIRKFKVSSNPFGIIYNPMSVFKSIDFALENKNFRESDLIQYLEVWSSFDFHSDISSTKKEKTLQLINSRIAKVHQCLKTNNFLFITFGSAWVYEKDKKIVANCHKLPSSNFTKRLLDIEEITSKAKETIYNLSKINNDLKIIFTISPVRHLRDGFVENNQSKAILHLAIKKIIEENSQIEYFPAYEYVLDDLRDYRFYKEDLLHPNALAINYILEKFDKTYFKENTLKIIKEVEKVNKATSHKVKHKDTIAFKKFQEKLILQIKALKKKGFDFSQDNEEF